MCFILSSFKAYSRLSSIAVLCGKNEASVYNVVIAIVHKLLDVLYNVNVC